LKNEEGDFARRKKAFFFCKNEARKLLKTNDIVSKKDRNKPETKLAMLLKTHNLPKK